MVARLCDGGEGGRFCSGCSVVRRGLVRRIADPTAAPGEDECAGVDRRRSLLMRSSGKRAAARRPSRGTRRRGRCCSRSCATRSSAAPAATPRR